MAKRSKYFVISLGGSIIAQKTGIDPAFLKSFKIFIKKQLTKGRRFILVIGGGATCRQYMRAASAVTKIPDNQMDWIGIRATILNATLVQAILGDMAHHKIITDPRVKLKTKAPVIVAAGWKPGFSSDMDAVILAEGVGAKIVINLSNISHVYDSDPNKNPRAQKIDAMTWSEFSKTFGTKWTPGLNAPFDPIAAQKAKKEKMSVIIADGRDLKNLGKILSGHKFEGTTIS